MNSTFSIYSLIMMTAALVSVSISVRVWNKRKTNSEATSLFIVLTAITVWIIAALIGLLDQNLGHKLLWAKVEYIGVISVPLALLIYILNHFGYRKNLTRNRIVWLAILPVATLILAWTNEFHHLIWIEYLPYMDDGLVLSQKTYGMGFWLYWVYSYGLLAISTVLTLHHPLRSSKIFRWQNIFLLIGILMPWVGNVLYVLHMNPFGDLDLTPLAFSITCISFAIGMFRWDLFDLRPVAQEAAIAGMTDGMLILDREDRILDMNPAAQKILGFDIQSLVGKQIDDVFSDLQSNDNRVNKFSKNGEALMIKIGAESRNFEVSDFPFYEKAGNPDGRVVLLHDTTNIKTLETKLKEIERQHAKILLQQAKNKFSTLYQNMSVGVIYWNIEGKIIEMNPAAEQILRANIEQINEMLSQPDSIHMVKEDGSILSPDHFSKMLANSLKEGLDKEVFGIYYSEEKNYRWVIISFIPQYSSEGNVPYRIFSTLDDITERKRTMIELRDNRETLKVILNAVSEAILLIDLNGNLITANETTAKRLGMANSDLIGKNVFDYIPEDVAKTYKRWVEIVAQQKKPIQFEDERPGEWIENNFYPVFDDNGMVHQIAIFGRDITTRKQNEIVIKKSMQETLQKSNTMNVLNQISNKIVSGLELNSVLYALFEESKKLWEINQFYVSLYDDETEMVSFPFSYLNGKPYPIASWKKGTISSSLTEYILDHLETFYIPDTHLLPETGELKRKLSDPTRSYAGVPLIIEDRVVGVLSIQSFNPNAYTQEQIRMLELLSTQAAIAIQNAQLYQKANQEITERRQTENVLRHHLSELEFLYESGLRFSQITTKEELIQQMAHLMEEKLNWPHITIQLCNLTKGTLETMAFSHGRSNKSQQREKKRLNSRVISIGEGISGWVAEQGESVCCSDLNQDPRYLKLNPELLSGLYVPIKVGDKVEAVINIESEQLNAFSKADEHLVSTLASQVGIKLANINLLDDLRKSNERIFQAYDKTIQGWSNALDLRDEETEGHTLRVTRLTEELALMMGIPDENRIHIRRGALLHDIGKMGISDRILLKPDKLTDEEWLMMRKHTVYAYNLLSQIDFLHPALNIPYLHHERWDGSGYPVGLKGEEIPLEARIFAIVDVYDALTSDRPYRLAWPKERAIEYIHEQSGSHFDPDVVKAFEKLNLR